MNEVVGVVVVVVAGNVGDVIVVGATKISCIWHITIAISNFSINSLRYQKEKLYVNDNILKSLLGFTI